MNWLLAPVAALWLAGCPFSGPVLEISPTAVSLNSAISSAAVTLSNGGSGALSWEIVDRPSWLSTSPISGEISGQSQALHLTSVTTGLTAGTYTGDVLINSDGGNRSIAVVLTVVAPPTLEVTPQSLDFGGSETTRTLVVRNAGAGTLTWSVTAAPPTAYSLSKTSGSLASGSSETVTVTLNRALLAPGPNQASISFGSNGGSQEVALAAVVQALQVSPLSLDFGAQIEELAFTITNSGDTTLNWTINNNWLPFWAEVSADAGAIDPAQSEVVVCIVDRTGIAPGLTEAQFTVASDGGTETLRLTIEGPDPVLFVTPLSLDFGSTDSDKEMTIQNTGTGTLSWTIEEGALAGSIWTAGDRPWLAVSPDAGDTAAGAAAAVTVTIDRTQSPPDPDTPHQAWLRIQSADGDEVYVAVSQITLPPTLRVLPQDLDFGTVYINRQLAIWNGGLGVIDWRIDTAGKPAWATLTPVDGSGIASGDVSGNETDTVAISVDRTGMTPADSDYAWTFEVTAEDENGAPLVSKTVRVTMNIGREATIAVDTGSNNDGVPNIDQDSIHFLPFGTTEDTMNFTVANVGTAVLVWSIDGADFPEWLNSVSPMQATLQPGQMTGVAVTVDREGLSYGNHNYVLQIESNDPDNSVFPVRIELQVPKRIVIGVKPKEIAMGVYGVSGTFDVANLGDPGSMLNFEVSTNKSWVYFYPETGSSEGSVDIIKNWVEVNVSVDRAQLDGTGSSAEIRIRAYETNAAGNRVYLENVPEEVVIVSVEAAELTFETAAARLRIPSLLRYVLLMRDIAYQPIPLPYDLLEDVVQGFNVYEKDVPINLQETNKFLTPGDNLRTNLVILLDYSGSMLASAQKVTDESISGAPDPLQALYNRCVGQLIDELPANYNVALMEFHDRRQFSRLVTAPDYGPAFTNDKGLLLARLESLSVPDHGATELLPAALDAAAVLLAKDAERSRIAFDGADVPGVLCISDGRLTTPPGKIKEVADALWEVRIRYFGLGWGDSILHEPLARLANGTGGHYYPTAAEASGELDDQGKPVMVPSVDALLDWCETLPAALDPCDQSILKDLQSQVVFSYVTLTEDTGVTIRLDASFDNPNDDDGVCLVDQKTISGSLTQKNFDLLVIAGDNRLGQISMRSDGIQAGAARVVIRAEYVPRNVSTLQFQITAGGEPFTAQLAPALAGGIVESWSLTNLGDLYTLESNPPGTTLLYGVYGDLLYLDFEGLPQQNLTVYLTVLDPVISGDEYTKYFVYPDSITVETESFLAPAFPTPMLDVTSLDLGTDQNGGDIILRNVGGHHSPTGVWLDWTALNIGTYATAYPDEGHLESTTEQAVIHVGFSRTGPPGDYWEFIAFECTTGTLGVTYLLQVPVFATILEPVLAVSTTALEFGPSDSELTFEVQNLGQSTLSWAIDPTAFPGWLNANPLREATVSGTPTSV
ncbi:MAG TPA: VWA domain-containing protein, partial [Candidatus Bathyarchaeia archaeon]|nr:VWA domain-containing protein [Candidatus Bathyarchaeia archaeon]